ncbi:MAG: hypothetical protein LC127_12400 [Chitinophagales bacterium]|nr:hypothetical protein [Chitinophagales bacterium]
MRGEGKDMETIVYVVCKKCQKCGSENVEWTTNNEIHGNHYICRDCHHSFWGGRLKNEEKNKKRPPYPSPTDLGIECCEICQRDKSILGYAETLETHHKDGHPTNNDRLNLWVLCTECHDLVHLIRKHRKVNFLMKFSKILGV